MATNSIERFKNWILEAVEGESQRLTKSASATPETPFKFSSNPFCLSMENKEQKADTDTGIRHNLLNAFSSSNLLNNLAKSPLLNKRLKTFITRSETRSRLYDYYRRSDENVYSVPLTAQARSPASSQPSDFDLRQNTNSKNASDSNSLDQHKLNTARNDSNRCVYIHAQNTQLSPEIKQKYDRQDSGIAGSYTGGESIPSLETGDNGATGVLEEVLDYSENVSHYIERVERDRQSVRDPFRVVRRPFRKRPRNIVSRNLSFNDHKQCTAGYRSNRTIPKLKIFIQYFQSSRQIRVMLTDLKNLDQLCQTDRDIKLHAKVCLMPKKRKQKSTTKREACHNFTFNDVFYFHNVDNLQATELRIYLYKNKGYVFLIIFVSILQFSGEIIYMYSVTPFLPFKSRAPL